MISSGRFSCSGFRTLLALGILLGSAFSIAIPSVEGQADNLRARFGELFSFGTGCGPDVLFCLRSGSGTPDFAQEAFSTNANATARELTRYLQSAVALGIATVPAPSAGSGEAFRLSPLGVPVRNDETSLGPILAERALTLGRGSFLLGANITVLRFEALRGVSLEDLHFNVVQRDLPPSGPPLGDPAIERTYLSVSTRMAFEARVANVFLTTGLSDRFDLSVLVPVVQASISGFSEAEIVPGEGEDPAAGFSFGGPTEDPKLRERAVLPLQKATGLGDLSVRGKLRLGDPDHPIGTAFLADLRIPTGREEDFLGSDGWWLQGLGVISMGSLSGFSPHLNIGGVFRSGSAERSALLGTVGFDHRASNRITLAGEVLAQFPLGENPLLRNEVAIRSGVGETATIPNSNLPTHRDHQLDASLGFKLQLGAFALVGNVLVPLNDGGLRGETLWTVGLQGGL